MTLGDVLRTMLSAQPIRAGRPEMNAVLSKLAIACRQDSIREFQLDPKQQEEFELNAKIMAEIDSTAGPHAKHFQNRFWRANWS
jgi:hypothetical protein